MPRQESNLPITDSLPALLEELQITRYELSKIIKRHGKSYSTAALNALVHGDLAPTMRAMETFAEALQIEPEFFAEFRLGKARDALDPNVVGMKAALRNLRAQGWFAEAGGD